MWFLLFDTKSGCMHRVGWNYLLRLLHSVLCVRCWIDVKLLSISHAYFHFAGAQLYASSLNMLHSSRSTLNFASWKLCLWDTHVKFVLFTCTTAHADDYSELMEKITPNGGKWIYLQIGVFTLIWNFGQNVANERKMTKSYLMFRL